MNQEHLSQEDMVSFTHGLLHGEKAASVRAYLQACASNGNSPPADLSAFVPWQMSASQLLAMKAGTLGAGSALAPGINSS